MILQSQRDAQEFRDKVDYEGGLLEYLCWGGVEAFPATMHDEAQVFDAALDALNERFSSVLKSWGVTY